MTREEAIRQLDGADIAVLNRDFFKFNQAIIMAISALRHQDVTDKYVGKMTNAQKIRAMNDEELAKLLCCTGWRMFEYKECLEWLKKPAEEDDHETS